MGGERDRRAGASRRHPLHRLTPQNPQRQNHAPPAPRTRHQWRSQRRHDDAGRFQRDREAEGAGGRVAQSIMSIDSPKSDGSVVDMLDPIYLPFSTATLAKHFAPVGISANTSEDYLRYYQESADRYRT